MPLSARDHRVLPRGRRRGLYRQVRFTADESNEYGITAEEGVEVGRILGRHGVADFLNVNGAYSGTFQGVNVAFPGMEAKSAPYSSWPGG